METKGKPKSEELNNINVNVSGIRSFTDFLPI